MKRKVIITFEIVAEKLNNADLKKELELELKNIAPTLVSNIQVQIIPTDQ